MIKTQKITTLKLTTMKLKKLKLTHYQRVRITEDFYRMDHTKLAEELNMPLPTLKNYAYELRVQDHRDLPPTDYMKATKTFDVDEFKCWITGLR